MFFEEGTIVIGSATGDAVELSDMFMSVLCPLPLPLLASCCPPLRFNLCYERTFSLSSDRAGFELAFVGMV